MRHVDDGGGLGSQTSGFRPPPCGGEWAGHTFPQTHLPANLTFQHDPAWANVANKVGTEGGAYSCAKELCIRSVISFPPCVIISRDRLKSTDKRLSTAEIHTRATTGAVRDSHTGMSA
jgi:hypothetical protein